MKLSTVGHLKEYLKKFNDDDILVRDDGDHTFVPVELSVKTILQEISGGYTEDYGENITPIKDYAARVNAIIIS